MPKEIDQVGRWTEVKVEIAEEYAVVFQKIVTTRPYFRSVYMDGFAGAGTLVTGTGEQIAGTPARIVQVTPAFSEYHFVEIDPAKAQALRSVLDGVPNVSIHGGDSNDILLAKILPTMTFASYRKGLLFLDPYGLHLDWRVVEAAGKTGCVDVLINFPVMDMNRTVLWKHAPGVSPSQVDRMNRFFGDERAWKEAVYEQQPGLFGPMPPKKRRGNDAVVEAYRDRLKSVAGFKFVSKPLTMTNEANAPVYYLIGASQAEPGVKVFNGVFEKWRKKGVRSV